MKKMKFSKLIGYALSIGMLLTPFSSQAVEGDIEVTGASLMRNGNLLTAHLSLDLKNLKVKSNEAVTFQPVIVNGADSLYLDGAGIYGRSHWYQDQRSGIFPLTGSLEIAVRAGKEDMISLQQNVEYQDWMNGSQLILRQTNYGCESCGNLAATKDLLAGYREVVFEPVFLFEEAIVEEVKQRELSGRAFIEFKVNQTNILPDYKSNPVELGKIISSIDSVKNDKDITVTSLNIKGTASPDGPYDNNIRLAKGRTEALKNYVGQLYKFPEGFIKTSYEPVDWDGLKEWIEKSNIDNKNGLLDIISGDIEPAAKNKKIQSTYPVQYNFLLENVYPSLRHSDYKIEYTIRQFNNVTEIAQILKTSPQKLSLNEMYTLSNTYVPGSEEYNEVFETAVRMYPNDETANLNAANAAMQRGDLQSAGKYLSKVGNGAKALYARGVYSALNGDFETGIKLVEESISMGIEDKDGLLQNMKEASRYAH